MKALQLVTVAGAPVARERPLTRGPCIPASSAQIFRQLLAPGVEILKPRGHLIGRVDELWRYTAADFVDEWDLQPSQVTALSRRAPHACKPLALWRWPAE